MWISVLPYETNTPLRIDAYAVMSFPIAFECPKVIARWNLEAIQRYCSVQNLKFDTGGSGNCSKSLNVAVVEEIFGVFAFKGLDHGMIV
jgi:hypothetical protein